MSYQINVITTHECIKSTTYQMQNTVLEKISHTCELSVDKYVHSFITIHLQHILGTLSASQECLKISSLCMNHQNYGVNSK